MAGVKSRPERVDSPTTVTACDNDAESAFLWHGRKRAPHVTLPVVVSWVVRRCVVALIPPKTVAAAHRQGMGDGLVHVCHGHQSSVNMVKSLNGLDHSDVITGAAHYMEVWKRRTCGIP